MVFLVWVPRRNHLILTENIILPFAKSLCFLVLSADGDSNFGPIAQWACLAELHGRNHTQEFSVIHCFIISVGGQYKDGLERWVQVCVVSRGRLMIQRSTGHLKTHCKPHAHFNTFW